MRLIGRESERAAIRAFAQDTSCAVRVLMLSGAAGVGKTLLWRMALDDARASGHRVQAAAPGEFDATLPFAVLGDLLRDVAAQWRDALPAPQRRALEVALLLSEPGPEEVDAQAVGLATLGALRALSAGGPLLLAIDDDQWTDQPSARALAFALRRLGTAPVGLLLARRAGVASGLAAQLAGVAEPDRCEELALAGLSAGALQKLVEERVGFVLPRPLLRRVHEVTAGVPLHALELARALGPDSPRIPAGAPLPVPRGLEELVADRVAGLPAATQAALAIAALAITPSFDLLTALGVADPAADLAPAIAAELLEPDARAIRFAHPLYASAISRSLAEHRRRDLHRRIAPAVDGIEARAHHMAQAVDGPDEPAAAALEQAAAHTQARGAAELAADLLDHAIELTPADHRSQLTRRRLDASAASHRASDFARARAHAQAALSLLPPGPERAEALLRFATASVIDTIDAGEQALREAGDDPGLQARIHMLLCDRRLLTDFRAAADDARAGVAAARRAGDDALIAQSLSLLGFVQAARGEPSARESLHEAEQIERGLGGGLPAEFAPTMNVGIDAMWRDDPDTARTVFRRCLRRAADAGDDTGQVFVLIHLAQVEWRAGRLLQAQALLDQLLVVRAAAGEDQVLGITLWLRTVIAAHRGRLDEAREAALEGLERNLDDRLFGARQRAALGLVELQAGDPQAAVDQYAQARGLLERLGAREPGIVLFAGDEIEALVATGQHEPAAERIASVERLGRELDRPRLRSVGARGRGMLSAAQGDFEAAIAALECAASEPAVPGLDRPRALLALGSAQRRARRRGDARRSLDAALEQFSAAGAERLAERARHELGRIGGRAPSTGGLTAAEARIAELVATGRSTKEVASTLVVSPRTVEGALTRIYMKLGVRSRAELAHRFAHDGEGD